MEVCGERPVWSTADGSISEVCRATCGPGQWEFIAARSSGGNRVGRNWRWPLIGCDAALPVVTGSHVRSRERDTPAAPPQKKPNHSRESTSKHSQMTRLRAAGTGTAWARRQVSSLYLSAGHSGGPRSTQMFLNNQYSLFHRNIWESRLWPPTKKKH